MKPHHKRKRLGEMGREKTLEDVGFTSSWGYDRNKERRKEE
jgi:hypothetical protein